MGSGRVLAGSECVLELKNHTSKIIEVHCKKQCFGLRRLPFRASGFGWVLAGSGRAGWVLERVLVGSGWVLELKNTTLKSLKFIIKKQCFGFMRLQAGAKMDSKNALFWSVKIVRIHFKKQGLGRMNVF